MKSQIMKKEEEVEKIEEEVVTLRSQIFKLNKNVEEIKTSTSVIENEEKHSRLLEKKNEENRKSYAERLKEGIMVNQNLRKLLKIHLQEKFKEKIQDYTTKKIIHSQVCKFILWSLFLLY
jgi:hypothetical protein